MGWVGRIARKVQGESVRGGGNQTGWRESGSMEGVRESERGGVRVGGRATKREGG